MQLLKSSNEKMKKNLMGGGVGGGGVSDVSKSTNTGPSSLLR